MHIARRSSVLRMALAVLFLALASDASSQLVKCSKDQTQAQIDARIDALIGQMTLKERVAQLGDRAPAIPRLGLPAYNWWNEGLHGTARDGYATVFPQAIGLAATWDPALLHAVGDTVSTEARAKFNGHGRENTPRYGGLTIWSPNINIFRDPRWGRGQETYGEDPVLTATLGTQFVRGVQGDDPFYLKADATPKHFAVHSGPEHGRDAFNAVVSAHDLADTYLPAFHALLTKGQAAALMCSYNEINGVPSCARRDNLDGLIRQDWNLKGYVVSDCDAVGNIASYHHYAPDAVHGAADALNAGVDLDCGNSYDALLEGVQQHLTTEAQVNTALHRLLAARIRLGLLDAPSCTPWGTLDANALNSPAHRELALRAAEESMVLLRNHGTLPLRDNSKRIAVVGASADMLKILEANYHGTAVHPVTPWEGLQHAFPHTVYAQGSLLADGVPALIPSTALRTSKASAGKAGLTAEYFAGTEPAGAPVMSATVSKVDLDLDRVGPAPQITSKTFAARWTGFLAPPAPGTYTLRVNVERCWDCKAHDSYKLLLDGDVLLENHGAKGTPDRVTLSFPDTRPHTLRLELSHTGDDEGIGLEWIPPASALLDEAVQKAATADVIVAFAGLSPDLEGEALQLNLEGFDGGDRTSLNLPSPQRTLLHRLGSLGKPMVVVLTSGSAIALGPEADAASAVLEAWYPGESGGEALAHLLAGEANFSGRLPVTFYRSVADLPAFSDYSMAHRTYRYFDGEVLFPFGFGLTYATFSYGQLQLQKETLQSGDPLTATVTVTNTGKVSGDEVAQLYLSFPDLPGAPRRALRSFQRVHLNPGESRTLQFTLNEHDLGTVTQTGTSQVSAGRYTLTIGGGQPGRTTSSAAANFTVQGSKELH